VSVIGRSRLPAAAPPHRVVEIEAAEPIAPDRTAAGGRSPSAAAAATLPAPAASPVRPPAAFRLEEVCFTYPRGTRALLDLSVELPAGCHSVIVGPSGSGKTTLLGCLSGRLSPTSGSIERAGSIATIYQDLRLVPQRSVLANVLDGALGRTSAWRAILGMPAAERREAMRLLDRVGLAAKAHRPVAALSGGERQRVAIARALLQRPAVLLADEPVCSLDRENAERVMELLTSLCRSEGVTLVSVLHDETLAARFASRRFRLERGRLDERRPSELPLHVAPTPAAACGACSESAAAGGGCGDAAALASPPCAAPVEAARPERPWWMHPAAMLSIGVAAVAAYAWSIASLGVLSAGGRGVLSGLWSFLAALLPTSWAQISAIPWRPLLASLVETLQMSLLGTTLGIAIAYPAAVLAAENTGPRFLRPLLRQILNALRTVPSLIWALLLVSAVGLGPLAGVLALAIYSVGYLSKFFYEAFEHAPTGPQQALREIGAGPVVRFARAVGPATRPAAIASGIFMLEYNVRAASVLGVVDAGGIGYYIRFFLEIRNFPAALACLLLIFGVVVLLDALSVRLRRRFVAE
jgi:phosphonate ABC transporter permease subunit PhnE